MCALTVAPHLPLWVCVCFYPWTLQSKVKVKDQLVAIIKKTPKKNRMVHRNALTIDTKQKDKHINLCCWISAGVYVKKDGIDQMFNPTPIETACVENKPSKNLEAFVSTHLFQWRSSSFSVELSSIQESLLFLGCVSLLSPLKPQHHFIFVFTSRWLTWFNFVYCTNSCWLAVIIVSATTVYR